MDGWESIGGWLLQVGRRELLMLCANSQLIFSRNNPTSNTLQGVQCMGGVCTGLIEMYVYNNHPPFLMRIFSLFIYGLQIQGLKCKSTRSARVLILLLMQRGEWRMNLNWRATTTTTAAIQRHKYKQIPTQSNNKVFAFRQQDHMGVAGVYTISLSTKQAQHQSEESVWRKETTYKFKILSINIS